MLFSVKKARGYADAGRLILPFAPEWPPHADISGEPGAGKTTVYDMLAEKYGALCLDKINCRPPRKGENQHAENQFVDLDEFGERIKNGDILQWTIHRVDFRKESYPVGILRREKWALPLKTTKLILSSFGSLAPRIKQECAPEMVTFFLTITDEDDSRRRLKEKCRIQGLNFTEKERKRIECRKTGIARDYDHIIYNDGTPEECVEQIERILGLTSPQR